MNNKSNNGLFWLYITLFLLWIFCIFFLWKEKNIETGTREFVIVNDWVQHFRKWLDVSWGTKLIYKISYDKYDAIYEWTQLESAKKQVEEVILKNIDNRISGLGVSDYSSYIQILDEERYIVVEIWGINDLEEAKNIIGKTVELEFKLPNEDIWLPEEIQRRKEFANNILADSQNNSENLELFLEDRESEWVYYTNYKNSTIEELPILFEEKPELLTQSVQWEWFPEIIETQSSIITQNEWGDDISQTASGFAAFRVNSISWDSLYTLDYIFVNQDVLRQTALSKKWDILNWAYFEIAMYSADQLWRPGISIQFNWAWTEVFCNITEENIWKPMAIFIWWELVTAPVIQDKICGGNAQITGQYTPEEAQATIDELNSGALPAPLILMQEEKISPSLWDNALQWALLSALIWILAIFAFMRILYWWKKAFVTLSVLLVFLSILSLFIKLIDYALSLSGIAAIILSIWMAVDANILIFERMREEQQDPKNTKINTIIDNACNRSWPAIRDWNLSTWIIALLLMIFGSNMFKGFWTMLIITILITILVNVPLTRILLKKFYKK